MKQKMNMRIYAVWLLTFFVLSILFVQPKVYAASHTASITTDRVTGEVTYTIKGLDYENDSRMSVQVVNTTTKETAYQKDIELNAENCENGKYTGMFKLADVNYVFANYTVTVGVGDEKMTAGTADLSVHTAKASLKVTGNNGAAIRSAALTSKETAGGVLVPGTGNHVSIQIWNKSRAATTATTVGAAKVLTGSHTWSIDVSKSGNYYGTWCARVVVTNSGGNGSYTLASAEYTVKPVCISFTTKKTKTLEKKKSFGIYLKGLQNVFGVSKVNFLIVNSKGKQVASVSGTKKNTAGTYYYQAVSMKKLKYNMDNYRVQAVVVDKNGKTYTLGKKTSADQRMKKGTLKVTKKKNATCTYKVSGAYIPGNIKKIEFALYQVKSGKNKKVGVYKAKYSAKKNTYTVTVKNEKKGKYLVKAYAYTNWNAKILLSKKKFTLKKSDMGKNGWIYEKYNGKKYRFYYVNNEKQTDLTKVLKLKKSSSTNVNNFYIEVNRAASVVTIYMYNKETKKYDTPVKTCTVCVGRDTATVAGTGGLTEKSSYTPIGTYSISTNGQSVKYTMKPMLEPDGSTCYARWTTHVVGNIYFHSIAVATDSHYALPAYRYNLLGTAASAGCIRMAVADAKWIYDYTSTGNKVKIIKGNAKKPGPLGKVKTIKVKGGINYDPTDPGVPDSRKKKDYKAKRISGYLTKKGVKVGY